MVVIHSQGLAVLIHLTTDGADAILSSQQLVVLLKRHVEVDAKLTILGARLALRGQSIALVTSDAEL